MKLDYERHTAGRYFENAFLERASKVHPATPFVFYIPLLLGGMAWGFRSGVITWKSAIPPFLLGIFVWQCLEYSIHRYFFHLEGTGPITRRLHDIVHGYHHKYPDDEDRLVMPLGASIPLSLMIAGLLSLLRVPSMTLPLYVGIMSGYLFYDFTHWSTHFRTPRTEWGKRIRAHHMAHHFAVPHLHFGISHRYIDRWMKTLRSS